MRFVNFISNNDVQEQIVLDHCDATASKIQINYNDAMTIFMNKLECFNGDACLTKSSLRTYSHMHIQKRITYFQL